MNDEKVYRINKEMWEDLARGRLWPRPVSLNINMDEVAWKKPHRYLTNVVDVDKVVITWGGKGRKAEVLDRYDKSLGGEDWRKVNLALDAVRKMESRKTRKIDDEELVELTNCERMSILLRSKKKRTARQSAILSRLREINRPIHTGMLLQ